MKGTYTVANRGLPPKISKIKNSQNYKMTKRKHSNETVNYTSGDIKIIETYGDLISSDIVLNDRVNRKESRERVNSKEGIKRSESKAVRQEKEIQTSDKNSNKCQKENNSSFIRIQDMGAPFINTNTKVTPFDSRIEETISNENSLISPKYKDLNLQSIYFDKNDVYTNSIFSQIEKNSFDSQSKTHRDTQANPETLTSADSTKFNQVYDFANHPKNSDPKHSACIRLFMDHKKLQNRLYEKKRKIEFEFKAKMSPKLSSHANKIKRDPNLYSERLYPYHKINSTNSFELSKSCKLFQLEPLNEIKDIDDLYGNHNSVYIYRKNRNKSFVDFDFKPKLNKKSISMAKMMESSMTRLTRKKEKKEVDDKIVNRSLSKLFSDPNSFSLYGNLLNTESSVNLSIASGKSMIRSKVLYEKALKNMENRQKIHEEKKKKEEEEYKTHSYRPKFVSKRSSRNPSKVKNPEIKTKEDVENSFISLYKRQEDWKRSIITRQQTNHKKLEDESANLHTFKPQINKSIKTLDMEFIKKANSHMEHSVSYVRNRRKSLEERENDMKKIKRYGENFQVKPTIPHEFNLSESHTRENIIKDKIVNLHNMRRELHTQIFFELDEFRNPIYYYTKNNNKLQGSDNKSYLKMYMEQNTTPTFTKMNNSYNERISDTVKVDSVESDQELDEDSYYFLRGNHKGMEKLDVTFDTKDAVIKALGNINEKFLNFN